MLKKITKLTAGRTLLIVVVIGVIGGWITLRAFESKQNELIEDPVWFADYTWPLIRQSVAICGDDQDCHRSFAATHISNSFSKENAEKVRVAMEFVTSGEASKKDRGLVLSKLGADNYEKLQSLTK